MAGVTKTKHGMTWWQWARARGYRAALYTAAYTLRAGYALSRFLRCTVPAAVCPPAWVMPYPAGVLYAATSGGGPHRLGWWRCWGAPALSVPWPGGGRLRAAWLLRVEMVMCQDPDAASIEARYTADGTCWVRHRQKHTPSSISREWALRPTLIAQVFTAGSASAPLDVSGHLSRVRAAPDLLVADLLRPLGVLMQGGQDDHAGAMTLEVVFDDLSEVVLRPSDPVTPLLLRST